MTLRAFLREETRADHERVDAAYGACDLADPRGYAAFLRAHHAALSGLPPLCPLGLPRLDQRAALEADLVGLGAALPAPLPRLILAGEPERLGAYYVVVGSRLGARVLADQLAATRAPHAAQNRYLTDRSADAAWRRLRAVLSGPGPFPNPDERERVLRGARAAFSHFEGAARADEIAA